jgi:hypothetical protein
MRIVAVADTHMFHADLGILPDGDVLIHAGDLLRGGRLSELREAVAWLHAQPHRHKIFVAGNHDWCFVRELDAARELLGPDIVYLEDSGVVLEGVRFWGSPWQPEYNQWAFNLPRANHWPRSGVDPRHYRRADYSWTAARRRNVSGMEEREGAPICERRSSRVRPVLHLFGHIHQDGGLWQIGPTWFANVTTWESERGATVLDVNAVAGPLRPCRCRPPRPGERPRHRSVVSGPDRGDRGGTAGWVGVDGV